MEKKFLPKKIYILFITATSVVQTGSWGKKKQNAKMKCSNLVLFKTQNQVIDTIIEVSVWY